VNAYTYYLVQIKLEAVRDELEKIDNTLFQDGALIASVPNFDALISSVETTLGVAADLWANNERTLTYDDQEN
jgi:hypothetical protein